MYMHDRTGAMGAGRLMVVLRMHSHVVAIALMVLYVVLAAPGSCYYSCEKGNFTLISSDSSLLFCL